MGARTESALHLTVLRRAVSWPSSVVLVSRRIACSSRLCRRPFVSCCFRPGDVLLSCASVLFDVVARGRCAAVLYCRVVPRSFVCVRFGREGDSPELVTLPYSSSQLCYCNIPPRRTAHLKGLPLTLAPAAESVEAKIKMFRPDNTEPRLPRAPSDGRVAAVAASRRCFPLQACFGARMPRYCEICAEDPSLKLRRLCSCMGLNHW